MNVPAKKFGARDVSPVDQVRIDKKIISLGIEQGNPDVDIIKNFSKGKQVVKFAASHTVLLSDLLTLVSYRIL